MNPRYQIRKNAVAGATKRLRRLASSWNSGARSTASQSMRGAPGYTAMGLTPSPQRWTRRLESYPCASALQEADRRAARPRRRTVGIRRRAVWWGAEVAGTLAARRDAVGW